MSMRIYQNLNDVPGAAKGCVLVIGNFDGIHRGHQALLARAKVIAQEKGCAMGVLTFEPHPRTLFRPDEPPSRITPFALKAERLEQCGADYLFSLPFDWDFASQSAQDFIDKILIEGLGAAHVVVGFDFRFGQLRVGTPEMIEAEGIPVSVIEEITFEEKDIDISSSRVRQFLRRGEIDLANRILGWPWEIRGIVFKGDQRGRELGYPTANMRLEDGIHPAYGIYAVQVQIEGENEWRMGATNIGIRPMFEVNIAQVETYIFDFTGDLYGKTLRVRPVKRLRGEAKFKSLEALVAQMEKDCVQAREILQKVQT